MPRTRVTKCRSGCPVSISLEILGDRWSLLIIRDLMVRGFQTFKEFQESGEGIATNVLADRLRRLQDAQVVRARAERTDARKVNYRLTSKGIDLAAVLFELLLWAGKHERTGIPRSVLRQLKDDREAFLAEVRRRWRHGDHTPLLPRFSARAVDAAQTRAAL